MAKSASIPHKAALETGMPITGRVVRAATAPARCAAMPAAQINTRVPSASYWLTSFSVRSGVRCAELTVIAQLTPRLFRTSTQGLTFSSSDFDPIKMTTCGIVLPSCSTAQCAGIFLQNQTVAIFRPGGGCLFRQYRCDENHPACVPWPHRRRRPFARRPGCRPVR